MSIITSIWGRRVLVPVSQKLVEYRNGTLSRVLDAGVYRIPDNRTVVRVTIAERLLSLAPQEIVTAESVPLRVSMTLRIAVTDPVAYVERSVDPDAQVYLAAQVALREALAEVRTETVLRRSDVVDTAVLRRTISGAADQFGIAVHGAVIKDVIVPAEVRAAAIELVTAKARGAARLEESRAETASLRALANAGRMLDASPALARLRMIQSAPVGAKIVFGADRDAEF